MPPRFKDALITAVIAVILALPLAGVRTEDGINGLTVTWDLLSVGVAGLLVFAGRLLWGAVDIDKRAGLIGLALAIVACFLSFPTAFLQSAAIGTGVVIAAKAVLAIWRTRRATLKTPSLKIIGWAQNPSSISWLLIALALVFPLTPLANRYALDVSIMVLTYVMLAWGLNITVGYAGLLDLGYAGFYALGAYCYAMLATHAGFGFWQALPLAGLVAAGAAFLLGFPVLRLRGDYFAVVTLGFGEIVRLVLTNWTDVTGGPNGIADIPRPTLFGLEFTRGAGEGHPTFADFFHIDFAPVQRVIFVYYVILGLALLIGAVALRLRRLPLGRAWESFREDEIACASLGINSTWIKLAAYSLSALVAGLAGAFFAARQGFVSPESFTFTESATILAIVILGGIGHPLGIVLASVFIIGLPELFRGFEQYRMIAFGLGMVLIMVWRPGGMMASRVPGVKMADTE